MLLCTKRFGLLSDGADRFNAETPSTAPWCSNPPGLVQHRPQEQTRQALAPGLRVAAGEPLPSRPSLSLPLYPNALEGFSSPRKAPNSPVRQDGVEGVLSK